MKGRDLAILVAKIAVLAVVLMMINGFASRFLPEMSSTATPGDTAAVATQPSGSFMAIVLTVMLLQTIALAYPIVRSKWSGWKLTFSMFLLYFGTVTFMGQIESLVYLGGKMPEGMLPGLFAMGFLTSAVFAPIAVVALGKWKPRAAGADIASGRQPASTGRWPARIALGGLVFLALYYLFGYYVAWKNPLVRDYYGGTDPGSFIAQMRSVVQGTPWMLPFQYVRGLLWVGLALLVIRMMKGPWWEAGIAVSLLFTVPSLYLALPNPMMPEAVRMAHLIETVPYQFLFGWFAAWLFRGSAGSKLVAQPA